MHRKCQSIFILKLEWKMTFFCISISTENWKLKKDNFQFSIFIEKFKNKIFVFRFSIFILFQNTKLPLIKLTIIQVNRKSFTFLKVILITVFKNTWLGNLRLLMIYLIVKRPFTTYLLLLQI